MSDRFLQGFMEDFIRGVSSPITANVGGAAYTPASTFLTIAGAHFYGWDNTDLKVNSDGTGGSVADGGTVGRWNDRSGYGNHISNAIANTRSVFKDNKVRCFWATDTTDRRATLFNLATATTFPKQDCSGGMIIDFPGLSDPTPILDIGASDLVIVAGDAGATNYRFVRVFNGAAYQNTAGTPIARKSIITWRSNATNLTINIDGTDHVLTALGTGSLTRLRIGSFNGGAPRPVNYREIVAFADDIGAADMTKLQTYLQTQASTSSLSTTKTVVIYGDSMSEGVGSEIGKPWHDYVTNRSTSKWYSFSKDGGYLFVPHVTAANLATYKGSTEGVAVMWICTNDIIAGGRTAAQCETDMWAYTDTLRAAGMKVLVCTLQDFATNRAVKDDFNARLVANWASHADGIVRLDTAPELDDAADTTYFTSDGVHLKDAGHAAVGALIQTAMTALA